MLPSLLRLSKLAAIFAAGTMAISPKATSAPAPTAKDEVLRGMRKAADFYRGKVATRGGYVYYYLPDLSRRWGEGEATPEQIWVQRPGTPAVGLAFLRAYEATKDRFYLDAATDAARALVQGQLESGGWTNSIDFAASGKNAARYRKMAGGPRDYSTLDDGISQHALRLLMRVDQALGFRDAEIHEATEYGLNALLKAQLASGAFPQVWAGPTKSDPVAKASYPNYEWRTENREKNYWDLPTLNDDLTLHLSGTLEDAWVIYKDPRFRDALAKLGDFLILAQMPDPQPGWAQQYTHDMHPAWARKFEPPAVAGRETQGAIKALLAIHRVTGDIKYLEPIPKALDYLKRSLLPDGKLARYYELKTNKPLYMTKDYALTYDDSDAPTHYGWKTDSKIASLTRQFESQKAGKFRDPEKVKPVSEEDARAIVKALDAEGRWMSAFAGESLVGQPKFKTGMAYISSEVFCDNLEKLCAYLAPTE